jgi:hypothetical protein
MLSSYRALFARAGARPLALACALGWFAFTGYGLAIILVVHAAAHSFSVAGGAVAAFSAGSGLAAPARGRLIDRRGAGGLAVFVAAHGCALAGLIAACALHATTIVLLGTAAMAGAVVPPLIGTARAVWSEVAGDELSKPAHALNASLADAAQLVSPGLTGALAAAFAPTLALAVLLAAVSAAGVVVVRIARRRRVSTDRRAAGGIWGVITESPSLRTLVACDVAGGMWTGAMEVAATALAARHGAAELAAVPLSAAACGGIAGALWVGSRAVAPRATSRYLGGSLLAALVLPLAVVSPSLASVTGISIVAGAGYGILGAALFELLDRIVPSQRAVEAFTWLTTGQAAGSAAGAALAGALVRRSIASAFLLIAVCAMAGAVIAVLRRKSLRAA